MKIYPDNCSQRNILNDIHQIESYIEEYRNAHSCFYWIFTFGNSELCYLYARLKTLRAELAALKKR
jgi:hypothetical protein